MSITAVVGANWGDEGKGKITDYLASQADFVVRFQGGNNAGHTIINRYGKFQLHLLPSGVFSPHVTNILSNGIALNVTAFLEEYNTLLSRGVPKPRIVISRRAQVVLPHHILLDRLEEKRLGEDMFGSTQTGMAPFYSDKYLKIGIQVNDLYCPVTLLEKVKRNIEKKNILLNEIYGSNQLIPELITELLVEQGEKIKEFVGDTREILLGCVHNKHILMEGQLGALKDPDHGIYPMVTSSHTLSSYAMVSTGLPARYLEKVVTVVKAYTTAVGGGPLVTEITGDRAEELRKLGGDSGEYGATTGRPRRVGWFDAVASRYGCELQGTTDVVLSLVDVLGYLKEIPVCISYSIDGCSRTDFPLNSELLRAEPEYITLKGWCCDISDIGCYSDLPNEAKVYIETIEKLLGFPITLISVGPDRDALIRR